MGLNTNSCLRWDDFESNLAAAFYDLREEADFFDVTLSCGNSGKKSIQAHRVILSACSSFFKNILRNQAQNQPHPNPYIYLKGISFTDLSSIVDFMYYGEVSVSQENLSSFLNVAEDLKIKGLLNKDSQGNAKVKGLSKEPRKLTYESKLESSPKKQRQTTQLALADFSHEKESFKTNETNSDDVKTEPDVEETNGYGGQSVIAGMIADYENSREHVELKSNPIDEHPKNNEKVSNIINIVNEDRRDIKPSVVRKLQATYTSEGLKIIPIPDDEEETTAVPAPRASLKALSPISEFVDKEPRLITYYNNSRMSDTGSTNENEPAKSIYSHIQQPNNYPINTTGDISLETENGDSAAISYNTSDEYFGEYGEQLDKMLSRIQNDWCCKMCGKKSDRKDNMRRHVENVHSPRVLQCKLCNAQVRNHQTFYRHMKVKHGLSKYKEVDPYKMEVTKPGEELISIKSRDSHQAHPQVTTRYVDKRSGKYDNNNHIQDSNAEAFINNHSSNDIGEHTFV